MRGQLVVLVALAVVVLLLLRARARSVRLDPFTLGEPWRWFVQDALQAQRRFHDTVRRMRRGPLHDRLVDVGRRLDEGVLTCWEVGRRGHSLDAGLRQLDPGPVGRTLAALPADDPARGALEAQLAAAERVAARAEDARRRLRVLTARLDESVARAVELSLQADDLHAVDPLAGDVDELVDELESLRAAVEETT